MAVKNFVLPVPLTSVNVATFDGANFFPINPGGFPNAVFMFLITNASDRNVIISWDGGTTSHEYVGAGTTKQFMWQTNSQPNNFNALAAKGVVLSAFGIVGGTGIVYLSGYYQPQAN